MKLILDDGTEVSLNVHELVIFLPYDKSQIRISEDDNCPLNGKWRITQLRDALTFILNSREVYK